MILATATLAFLASAEAKSNSQKNSHLKNSTRADSKAAGFWLAEEFYGSDDTCGEGSLLSTEYQPLGRCDSNVAGESRRGVCFEDPIGGKTIIIGEQHFTDSENCEGDYEFDLGDFGRTSCEDGEDGSYKYRCILGTPFSVDTANTVSDVLFIDDECTSEFDNVDLATTYPINKCVSGDDIEFYISQTGTTIKSVKVTDCGEDITVYTDDDCEVEAPVSAAFTVNGIGDYGDDDFDCQDDGDSWQSFCGAGAPAKTGKKGKKAPRQAVSTFEVKLEAAMTQIKAGSQMSLSQQSQMSPMNFAMGSFIGIAIGTVAAKFYKSRAQFEGIDTSAHSNL